MLTTSVIREEGNFFVNMMQPVLTLITKRTTSSNGGQLRVYIIINFERPEMGGLAAWVLDRALTT
jgi:hypothetical protein